MIVSNLYETDRRLIHPDTDNQIVDEFTRRVYEIGQDKADSYFLGWIKKDTLPSNCLCSSLTVEGEQGSRTFTWENITDDDNFPCGYISGDIEGANQFNTTISRRLQYINQLYPEYSCEMESIGTTWNFYLYDSTGEHLLGVVNSRGITIPIKTFARLCMGYTDASFTITFNDQSSSPAVDRHFTLTPDNLGHLMDESDDYLEWIDEDDDQQTAHCKLRVALRGFYVPPGRRYHNRPQYEPFNAQWFVKTTCTLNNIQYDHYAYSQSPDTIYPYNDGSPYTGSDFNWYGRIFEYPQEQYLHHYVNKIIQFGVHGEFTETQLDSFISSQNLYIVSNNIFGYKDNISSTWAQFVPLYKFTDIFKCLCLQYRTDIDVTSNPDDYLQGYIPGRTYATDVTENDEFLAKWKTGDINDPAFKESLRPWQYENFQENDFTEDDIPQPEPEPGGDTPGDEPQDMPHDDGDPPDLQKNRYIGIPSNFVTQYALTSVELTTIGTNLWQSWLTAGTDVLKNFFLPYSQDFGTLNIAACMDYIISLKIFPFEFRVQDYIMTNGVRMGTGHTDFLGGSAPVIKSQIICVDAGSCTITLPNPYNDFRDMYNCSALCIMPYCGSAELNLQEILGRTLKASYFIDCQSGGCTCVIECVGDEGDYLIASKTGQIGFSLPMTATNAGQLTAQLMGDATKAVGTIAGTFFSNVNKARDLAMNIAGVNQAADNGMDFDYAQSKADYYQQKANLGIAEGTLHGALGLANQAIDMLSRSGVEMPMLSGGGSAESFMFADCVSIQIRRGKYKKPDNYPHSVGHYNLSSRHISDYRGAFSGRPSTGSNTGKGLCTFTGIDTSGLNCREDERAEIISLLESGVYL